MKLLTYIWHRYTLSILKTAPLSVGSYCVFGLLLFVASAIRNGVNVRMPLTGLLSIEGGVGGWFVVLTAAGAGAVFVLLGLPFIVLAAEAALFDEEIVRFSYKRRALSRVLFPAYVVLFGLVGVPLYYLANFGLVGSAPYDWIWKFILSFLASPIAVLVTAAGWILAVIREIRKKPYDVTYYPSSFAPWTFGELNLDVGAFGTESRESIRRIGAYTRNRRHRVTSSDAMRAYLVNGSTTGFSAVVRARSALSFIRQAIETRRLTKRQTWGGLERLRDRLMKLIHVSSGTILTTSSTTNAVLLFANAVRFRTNRVITTDIEHPVIAHVLRQFIAPPSALTEIDIRRVVEGDEGPNILLEKVSREASRHSGDTALWVFSHVDYATGAVLPVPEMCAVIRRAAPQHLILVDGAHGPGNIEVRAEELTADAYAFCGHKWLMGTPGSGFLWLANQEYFARVDYEGPSSEETGFGASASRASLAMEPFLSSDAYVAMLERRRAETGWPGVLARQFEMRELLRTKLSAMGDLQVVRSTLGESAILAFRVLPPREGDTRMIIEGLREHFIVGSYLGSRNLGRFCIPYFVDRTDIENVARDLASTMRRLQTSTPGSSL